MKAYMVFSGDPYDGCILVFAETANKARSISYDSLFHWDYIGTLAHRCRDYDQYYNGRAIIESNSDLPKGAPDFYNDDIDL